MIQETQKSTCDVMRCLFFALQCMERFTATKRMADYTHTSCHVYLQSRDELY